MSNRIRWTGICGGAALRGLALAVALPLAGTAGEAQLDPEGLGFDPFAPLSHVGAAERYPQGMKIGVAKDGSILVNGKPRYLTATIWYGGTEFECGEDTPGYIDGLKWFYVNMPDYEAMQRLGLDAGGIEAPLNWMKRLYRPWTKDPRIDPKRLAPCVTNGLPIYVDFTASEWSHGSMWHSDNSLDPANPGKPDDGHKTGEPGRLPNETWTVGSHHWVPYSIVEPHGRAVWLNMWREGAKDCLSMAFTRRVKTGTGRDTKEHDEKVPVRFRPWCYELMNEPAVFDESAYMKKSFAAEMKRKFGADVPAAGSVKERVEYTKFNEGCFASLLSEGAAAIKSVDPEARICFQPCTIRTRGMDLYRSNKDLDVICSQTGGRGIMESHMLRGMADGKPIVDSEMYVGQSTNSIRNAFMDQYSRGFNVSYMFKWSRRPGDWRRVHEVVETEGRFKGAKFWKMWPEESLKNAKKPSAYNFMNPYQVGTDQLLGIRIAKREAQDVNEFFTPRDRGVPRKVAVLFSSPTERLAQCAGHFGYRLFDQAIVGAEFAHLLPDVIYEDQITNTLERLSRYDVLVAAGVDAVYPGAAKTVRKWVENGGSLVLVGETMGLDEYGEPAADAFPGVQVGAVKESEAATMDVLGAALKGSAYRDTALDGSWEALASIAGQTGVARKKFGKGTVWFANAKLSSEAIGRLAILAGAKPCCETADALSDKGGNVSGIEVHPSRRGALDAYLVAARTLGTQVIRFKPMRPVPSMLRLWTAPAAKASADAADPRFRDLVGYRQPLAPDADGTYVLVLKPGDTIALVAGTPADLATRYPKEGAVYLPTLTAKQALAEGRALIEAEKAQRVADKPAFDVDPNRTRPLDLRKFANRRFVDKVANDGRDGWTDQGAQMCLTDTPWGMTNCNGVPMDFIRYDQNGYKDCIVMASKRLKASAAGEMPYPEKIEGIRVDGKVANLYFLHAIGWGTLRKTDTAMTYVFNYGDGTKVSVPIRAFREVWDWGFLALTKEMTELGCFKGWNNAQNRGLYVWRWHNPNPEKSVASIDVISANGQQIPLLAAITAEAPAPASYTIPDDGLRSIGGSKGVHGSVTNGVWKVMLDDNAPSWCTAACDLKQPLVLTPPGKYARLTFEMNRLPDAWGAYHDHATPQFKINGRTKEGKLCFGNWTVAKWPNGNWAYRTDNDPETWQKVVLPMHKGFAPEWFAKAISIVVQFQTMPAEHSGLAFRNFTFEEAGE